MEPKLRQYYATHGKHVGDGMVYYFFPQPDCSYVLNAIRCAHEMKATMLEISRAWRARKNWLNDLKLNIGLHEGQEWFGTYQTPTHIEFTVLGDTINMAARLSDFARQGSIWVSKTMLGKLTARERESVRFGIRRQGTDGAEILVPATYSRIANLIDPATPKYAKISDIAMMAVTEVLDVAPAPAKAGR
jgi:class 3 adenylate cyclase